MSPQGGFDEQDERHPELDRLAHLFMINVVAVEIVIDRKMKIRESDS